ncbi:monovalent cation/H(+) antiporter subunit G [Aeromicrobium duanguangcaii]|uniref:Monovalent cation/H(+) antiporter subunit G n=1 Tax=Aeromicrobium duanguangcaii TaxID=2968086 RepID=A0ABY5KIJ4_9ACTN|nr:monovalent cation/H(+) antiporter subunit G [Aeromicrobium duanguangcaii]MCD9154097.1 monovalent cation/H(+) antiporter subunit G [Aeromicrobium duanguangcaii]MCL3837833.1 monovalent cation/H(+) antiporter subunit G [Aeromicrobium duanguangcaii]UUI68830.1 monovalent cation/H(+) antiporter subunit G [Aeromicrobium duanguangcaii]
MSWGEFVDVVAGILLVLGAGFAFVAAVGVVRFPDVLTRMHAATKPQTFGLLLILAGLALRIDSLSDLTLVAVVALFQLMTAPVSAHMVARATFRTGQVDREALVVDEGD